jgi:hypothetical protein
MFSPGLGFITPPGLVSFDHLPDLTLFHLGDHLDEHSHDRTGPERPAERVKPALSLNDSPGWTPYGWFVPRTPARREVVFGQKKKSGAFAPLFLYNQVIRPARCLSVWQAPATLGAFQYIDSI